MRKYLRGWNLHLIGIQKREKEAMMQRIKDLDKIAEFRLLTSQEWEERIEVEDNLERSNRSEEIYWKQRAGNKWLLEADANTHFFHQFANGRRRKNMISFLDSEAREIRGQKEITEHIVNFYKTLFGPSEDYDIDLKSAFWPLDMKLSDSEKEDLIKPFGEEEVRGVVMEMKTNSAPGPNGFSVIFFQKFWGTIKKDMLEMFFDFWEGRL